MSTKPNPFAPFKPPFRYDEQQCWIVDSRGHGVGQVSGRVSDEDTARIGEQIAAAMNRMVAEGEKK